MVNTESAVTLSCWNQRAVHIQNRREVISFSRTPKPVEKQGSGIRKEVYAMSESLKKNDTFSWLVTIFDWWRQTVGGIYTWESVELKRKRSNDGVWNSSYGIVHPPGRENIMTAALPTLLHPHFLPSRSIQTPCPHATWESPVSLILFVVETSRFRSEKWKKRYIRQP